MTTLGIGLIVIGVALVCGGLILRPRASQREDEDHADSTMADVLRRLEQRRRSLEINNTRPAVPPSPWALPCSCRYSTARQSRRRAWHGASVPCLFTGCLRFLLQISEPLDGTVDERRN